MHAQSTVWWPNGPLMNVEEFIAKASPQFRSKNIHPYCPACQEVVYPYGHVSPNVTSRFDHYPLDAKSDPMDDCLLANRTNRFRGMYSDGWDEDRGRRLRGLFFEPNNLSEAYVFCLKLCRTGNLPAAKFKELIDRAVRKRIWCYHGIPLWTIPYVLLALGDFGESTQSPYPFHFVLVKSRSTPLSQIWQPDSRCQIRKVFSTNGKSVKTDDNPFPIDPDEMKKKAGNSSWVSQSLLTLLSSAS